MVNTKQPSILCWKREIRQKLQKTPKAELVSPVSEWEQAVKTTHNWKAPGSGKLCGYWFKAFPAAESRLRAARAPP